MKTKLFALVVCTSLSASIAFATDLAKNSQKKPCPNPQYTKNMPCKTEVKKPVSREEMKKQLDAKMAKDRAKLYEELCLTPEQKIKAEELFVKSHNGIKPLMKKLKNEERKLADLKSKKTSKRLIMKQKRVIRFAKADIKLYMEQSQKEFKAILTKEQAVKYDAIIAERKAKMDEFRKLHRHNPKHHPKHRKFNKGIMPPPPPLRCNQEEPMPFPPCEHAEMMFFEHEHLNK